MKPRSKCLTTNIIRVQEHLEVKKSRCTPLKHCWIFLFYVNAFYSEASHVLVILKVLTTFFSNQCSRMSGLVDDYFQMTGMYVLISYFKLGSIDTSISEVYGNFSMTHIQYLRLLESLRMRVLQ